ncbi:hypothetical protein ACETK8_15940 [Brevundimonas staleyi]|uniref:XRE family transcriptional regulator n=1 Tax=Brevundimonas staleyi TaxID=74326 RepID=A0ABW0G109_9CAUL
MTDAAYVAEARRSLRRRLFQRFKALGLPQDQVIQSVAKVERSALDATHLADLAAIAAAAGPAVAALAAAAPGDPALTAFVAVRDSTGDVIRDLATYEP